MLDLTEERPRQWPYWVGAGVVGVLLLAIGGGAQVVGGLILVVLNYAGMFVMSTRIADRKDRSTGWAIFWTLCGGWLTVGVYALLPYRQERDRPLRRPEVMGPSIDE